MATFPSLLSADYAMQQISCIKCAVDSKQLICLKELIFGYYEVETGVWEAVLCGRDLTHKLWSEARDAFIKHRGTIKNEQEPEPTPQTNEASTAPTKPTNEIPADVPSLEKWERISNSEAAKLAEKCQMARPGTFTAAGLKWKFSGNPPLKLIFTCDLTCVPCGKKMRFELSAMSTEVWCEYCKCAYRLFCDSIKIAGKPGKIVVASTASALTGNPNILPELVIQYVVACSEAVPEKQSKPISALERSECMDREKVREYVKAGGDINARESGTNWTMLHIAATEGRVSAVRNLLEFGANPSLPVIPGKSRLTIQVVMGNRQSNWQEVAALLAQHGATLY